MKKSNTRFIAILQLAGGLFGVVSAFVFKFQHPSDFGALVYTMIFVLLFGFSLLAGLLLLKGRNTGFFCSMLFQAVQIPHICTGYFLYSFFSGLELRWVFPFTPDRSSINVNVGGNLNFKLGGFAINNWNETPSIGVNFIAVICLMILVYNQVAAHKNNKGTGYLLRSQHAEDSKGFGGEQ